MIIYKTTNLINQKIYIGKDARNKPNYYGSGRVLKLAILKYGKANFKKEIIEDCGVDLNLLNNREKYWIRELKSNTQSIGYNLTEGGAGGDTFTNNPNKNEINKKRSQSLKGKLSGEKNPSKRLEVRKKISDTLKRKYASGEISPSYKKGKDNPNTGKKRTEEQKLNIKAAMALPSYKIKRSASLKEAMKNMSDEVRIGKSKKISIALTGQKRTNEQNEYNRKMQIKRFENPENRIKNSKAQKKRFKNETVEQKEERSQKLKIYHKNIKADPKYYSEEEKRKRSDIAKKTCRDHPELHILIGKALLNRPRSEETKEKIRKTRLSNKFKYSEKSKEKMSLSAEKYVYEIISPEGKKFVVNNLNKFCKENNLTYSNMRLVVIGRYKQYKRWQGKILEIKIKLAPTKDLYV